MVFINDASGRMATNYTPNCIMNEQIKAENGITDNYNYRLFLQRNALKLMNKDRQDLANNTANGCGKCQNCLLSRLKKYKN